MSLFFTLCLDLLIYAKQTNHQETKKTKKRHKKTEKVINSDLTLGLTGDLANQTKALTTGERGRRRLRTMRNTKSVAFSTCFTHTYSESCTHSSRKRQRRHSGVSLWLRDGWRERKRERKERKERGRASSCWWGWTEPPLQRYTDGSLWKERITCARLLSCHILIPRPEPIWEPTLHPSTPRPSTRHRTPQQSPPRPPPCHSALQPSALPPLCCRRPVSGTRSQNTHTFHQNPNNNWPASLSRTTRWRRRGRGGGDYSLTLC